jgi:hypothetical protein
MSYFPQQKRKNRKPNFQKIEPRAKSKKPGTKNQESRAKTV